MSRAIVDRYKFIIQMDSQESYSQEVYEILRDFLPQIQRQIKDQLENKFRRIYDQRLQNQMKQFEQQTARKYQDQLVRAIKEKEIQIKADYERILESKIQQIETINEEALRKFKQQVREKQANQGNKQQQFNALLQQKANWEKLQKQYQTALRELGNQEQAKIKISVNNSMANSRGKASTTLPVSSSDNTRTKITTLPNTIPLKIDIPRQRRLDIEADLGSDMFRKEDNVSDYSSLLSPPHIDHEQMEKRKPSLKENTNSTSEKKKPFFWNEEKKKELLDMIRKRIM